MPLPASYGFGVWEGVGVIVGVLVDVLVGVKVEVGVIVAVSVIVVVGFAGSMRLKPLPGPHPDKTNEIIANDKKSECFFMESLSDIQEMNPISCGLPNILIIIHTIKSQMRIEIVKN
jgi:hypothetical protein